MKRKVAVVFHDGKRAEYTDDSNPFELTMSEPPWNAAAEITFLVGVDHRRDNLNDPSTVDTVWLEVGTVYDATPRITFSLMGEAEYTETLRARGGKAT